MGFVPDPDTIIFFLIVLTEIVATLRDLEMSFFLLNAYLAELT